MWRLWLGISKEYLENYYSDFFWLILGFFRYCHQMLITQLDPLTEQQVMGIYSLQHSSQQAEEALSQGLDQLQQSLIDTVSGGGSFNDGLHHMAVAMGKLTNLEGFVRQVIQSSSNHLYITTISSPSRVI